MRVGHGGTGYDLGEFLPGIGSRLAQRAQHALPSGQRVQGATVERPAGGLDAIARCRIHIVSLLVQACEQAFAQCAERFGDSRHRAGKSDRGLVYSRADRENVALQRPVRHLAAGREPGIAAYAGEHLMADQAQQSLGRVRSAGVRAAQVGLFAGKAAGPARRRQRAGRLQCRLQRRFQHWAGGDKLLDPPLQAAGARPAPLGAEQPAAQFRSLHAGQFSGERPVRRVEHVMAFVENVSGRHRAVVEAAPRGLGHHQGVIGNDKLRPARPADRVFDEAATPMRAGGVDAFAAPVGKAEDGGRAEQFGEPAGQVASLDVAIGRDQRPAGNQAEQNDRGRRQPGNRGAQRVLHIEQAEVVFPAFAHHDALVALGRFREEMGQLRIDLALQVAGESADPHAAVVLLGPHAGRCEVAERLAGPGPGLGQHEMRIAAGLAWRERGGSGSRVIGLARPLLRVGSQHGGEPCTGLGFSDRMRGRRRERRSVLPFRQAFPDAQRLVRRRRIRPAECRRDERRPPPTRLAHTGRQPRGVAVQSNVPTQRKPMQQRGGEFRQQRHLGLQATRRRFEIQHQGEAARCRCGRTGRQCECEQLQQIECRHAAKAKPAECRGRMNQNGRRRGVQVPGRVRGGQQQQFAVGGEDGGAAMAGYNGRRVGQGNSRHGFQLAEVTADSLDAISPWRYHP